MKKSIPLALCAVLPVLAHASQFATGGVEAVVPGTGDVTHTFTNTTASETFTLSQAATVRLLVVGGGGGGRDCAGGAAGQSGADGAANTGGGGGGAGANSTSLSSGAGGSGLVVVRMRTGQDGIVILVR